MAHFWENRKKLMITPPKTQNLGFFGHFQKTILVCLETCMIKLFIGTKIYPSKLVLVELPEGKFILAFLHWVFKIEKISKKCQKSLF